MEGQRSGGDGLGVWVGRGGDEWAEFMHSVGIRQCRQGRL